MRDFIVKQFALYGRVKSNIPTFLGILLWLAALIMFIFDEISGTQILFFALGCVSFGFGIAFVKHKTYMPLRCGSRIFSTFLLLGLSIIHDRMLSDTHISIVSFFIMAVIAAELYISFIYFRTYPLKWEELDDEQKYDYGSSAIAGDGNGMDKNQYQEWKTIAKKYQVSGDSE